MRNKKFSYISTHSEHKKIINRRSSITHMRLTCILEQIRQIVKDLYINECVQKHKYHQA